MILSIIELLVMIYTSLLFDKFQRNWLSFQHIGTFRRELVPDVSQSVVLYAI